MQTAINNLVIGSSGGIGKIFVEYLRSKDENVTEFDIKRSVIEDARSYNFHLEDYDYVYLLAWDVGGSKYLYGNNQLEQLQNNVDILKCILSNVSSSKCKFLFVSTELAGCSDNSYGVAKRLGEVWTTLVGGVSLRLCNVYGYIESVNTKSHVVPDFICQGLTNKTISLLTDGQEERQFLYIDDVCDALYTSIRQNDKRVYKIVPNNWVSILKLANIIAELTNSEVKVSNCKGYFYNKQLCNDSNIPLLPNWQLKTQLLDGIQRTVDSHRNLLFNTH